MISNSLIIRGLLFSWRNYADASPRLQSANWLLDVFAAAVRHHAMKADSQPAPRKSIGIWTALALVMGSMIGSGVFLLPASLAPLGWNSVFGWLITVTGALCIAAVFARLARRFPEAGGPYAYTRHAFGTGPAFAVAWAYWISLWVGNAAIATGAVSYLSRLFPVLGDTGNSAAATIAIVWGFTFVNLRGVETAGKVQLVTTIVKMIPLIAVAGLACYVLAVQGTAVIRPLDTASLSVAGISAASTLTLWAMLGLETATVPADQVDDPERTIPRATLLGTAGAGVIYIIVCSAVVLMLPAALTATSPAPFADFVERYGGADAGTAIAAFGAISALGALNGWILIQAELPAAIARDGLFPAWLGARGEYGAPVYAHLLSSSLLTIVLILNFSRSMASLFEFLILLTTSVVLVMYLGCAAAAARLMMNGQIKASAGFIAVVVLAAVFALWTIYGAGTQALLWGLLLLAAGFPVYALGRRSKTDLPLQ
jgi:basic amino acid/polyamine antiporter, APA family